jgi:hypothetical protein
VNRIGLGEHGDVVFGTEKGRTVAIVQYRDFAGRKRRVKRAADSKAAARRLVLNLDPWIGWPDALNPLVRCRGRGWAWFGCWFAQPFHCESSGRACAAGGRFRRVPVVRGRGRTRRARSRAIG